MLKRKQTKWRCTQGGAYITETKTYWTVEMQQERTNRCYENCRGYASITAYDVQTVDEFEQLEWDEQRRVAQQIDEDTPRAIVVHVLEQATGALNHEDEDYIPAIRRAIQVLSV